MLIQNKIYLSFDLRHISLQSADSETVSHGLHLLTPAHWLSIVHNIRAKDRLHKAIHLLAAQHSSIAQAASVSLDS
eukprot:7344-Heterococcus_DN1.PRE.1